MLLEKNDRIVFAGDSVTDMGSANPVGEGLFDNLGRSYVRVVENMLYTWYPDYNIRVTNSGISGNTSRDLLARWDRDVMDLKPQWVSICIGINDVWRQFDSPAFPDYAVPLAEYETNVEKMVQTAKAAGIGVVLMTPYFMEPCREDRMRRRMDEYGAVCKRTAERNDVLFLDMQKVYDDYFACQHSALIAWDRIHPNQIGATLMARAFLELIGFDFSRRI